MGIKIKTKNYIRNMFAKLTAAAAIATAAYAQINDAAATKQLTSDIAAMKEIPCLMVPSHD